MYQILCVGCRMCCMRSMILLLGLAVQTFWTQKDFKQGMGRMGVLKWEKSTRCAPVHNIISSDFPKYNPQPWKFMEGKSRIGWLLSYEYYRMWLEEREAWKKRMYPENTTVNVDIVKSYVLSFKTNNQAPKPEKKTPFKMKKFEGVGSKTENKRAPGDKAMGYQKEKKKQKPQDKTK